MLSKQGKKERRMTGFERARTVGEGRSLLAYPYGIFGTIAHLQVEPMKTTESGTRRMCPADERSRMTRVCSSRSRRRGRGLRANKVTTLRMVAHLQGEPRPQPNQINKQKKTDQYVLLRRRGVGANNCWLWGTVYAVEQGVQWNVVVDGFGKKN
jgi:hypothetical protein